MVLTEIPMISSTPFSDLFEHYTKDFMQMEFFCIFSIALLCLKRVTKFRHFDFGIEFGAKLLPKPGEWHLFCTLLIDGPAVIPLVS